MKVTEVYTQKFKLPSESERAESKDKMEKMRKAGSKMVKGMFEFLDAQGGWLDFSYRFYPGEPIRTVHITHGEITDVPVDVMKHLNNTWKKVRKLPDNLDEKGKINPVTKISRTRFTPMDAF